MCQKVLDTRRMKPIRTAIFTLLTTDFLHKYIFQGCDGQTKLLRT